MVRIPCFAGGTGSIPGQGIKIPQVVWRSQKKIFFKLNKDIHSSVIHYSQLVETTKYPSTVE